MSMSHPGAPTDVPMDFETALSVDAVEEAARELAGDGPVAGRPGGALQR